MAAKRHQIGMAEAETEAPAPAPDTSQPRTPERHRSKAVSIEALPKCRTIRYPARWGDGECVTAYNKAVGIISTTHKHTITPSDEAPDHDQPRPAKA